MADSYISIQSAEGLQVPVKAAAVFAAHESSLFLGGQLVPVIAAPTGLVRVPTLAGGTAHYISGAGDLTADVQNNGVTAGNVDIVCDLIAARAVLRDLGAIDPAEIGRQLGNKVSATFDAAVTTVMGNLTAGTTGGATKLADIFGAIGAIRAAGETGQLYGVVSADLYASVLGDIGSAPYAGGDVFQGAALRSGLLGAIAGVPMFVSSYMTTGIAIFGQDAMKIAMQANVNVEVGRRPEAVGFDVVASLHAKAAMVDATRGRYLDYTV